MKYRLCLSIMRALMSAKILDNYYIALRNGSALDQLDDDEIIEHQVHTIGPDVATIREELGGDAQRPVFEDSVSVSQAPKPLEEQRQKRVARAKILVLKQRGLQTASPHARFLAGFG